MLKMRNQKGFTLIEIIAVLVILGILAAVAIPKFLDLQDEARNKALEGALAAGASQLTMQYSRDLLTGNATANTWTPTTRTFTGFQLGDFTATLYANCGVNAATVTITGTTPSWITSAAASKKYKALTVCQ